MNKKLLIIEKSDWDSYDVIAYLYVEPPFDLVAARKEFTALIGGFTFIEPPKKKKPKMTREEKEAAYLRDIGIAKDRSKKAWDDLVELGYMRPRETYEQYSYEVGRLDERQVLEAFVKFLIEKYNAVYAEDLESCSCI